MQDDPQNSRVDYNGTETVEFNGNDSNSEPQLDNINKLQPDKKSENKLDKKWSNKNKEGSESVDNKHHKDIDGGWAYLVLVGCLLISALTATIAPCFGLLFSELTILLEMTHLEIFSVFNLHGAFFSFMLFTCGSLCDRFGFKAVCFSSSILLSVSLCLLSACRSKAFFIIDFGVIIGVAIGLSYYSTFYILPKYFIKRRGFALSFNVTGVAVGKIFIPHIIWALMSEYGYEGGILIYGAIISHCCIIALTFRKPPDVEFKNDIKQEFLTPRTDRTLLIPKENKEIWRDIRDKLEESCNALSSHKVIINAISMGSFMMSKNNFMMLIPFWMISEDYSYSDAAWCLSSSAFSNCTARILASVVSDYKWFRSDIAYMTGAAFAGIACCAFPFQTNRTDLMVTIVVWGFGLGLTVCQSLNVLIATVGIRDYPAAVSACGLVTSISYVIGIFLFGMMPTNRFTYTLCIVMAGFLQLVPTIAFLFMPLATRYDTKKIQEAEL